MLRNLAIAFAVIGLAMGLLVFAISRYNGPERPAAASVDGGTSALQRSLSGNAAARELQQIAEMSQRLMPDGFERLFITMNVSSLQELRPRARHDPNNAGSRNEGIEVWEEDEPNGTRVIYQIGLRSRILQRVQFLSRVTSNEELRGHFAAMNTRYGRPTGVYDCPDTETTPPMRRFTWRREGASLMEAVLIHGSNIALTLVVLPTVDAGRAIAESRCEPVRSAEQLARFPVASSLRGQSIPFVREVPRDQ